MTPSHCPVNPDDTSTGADQSADCPHAQPTAESTATKRGRPIPHVTPLKGEEPDPRSSLIIRPDGQGIGYHHELPDDRDPFGVLWVRTSPPRAGRPIALFRQVHPARSRDAMLGMLCQVCFKEASRTRAGVLFILKPDKGRDMRFWPDTEYTIHPPTCLPCTQQALIHCPFMRDAKALRAKNPQPWGVFGTKYYRDEDGRLRTGPKIDRCLYNDLRLSPWVLASQPVARLSRCTQVDLRAELLSAGLELPAALTA